MQVHKEISMMGRKVDAPKASNAPGYLFLALLIAGAVAGGAQSHEHPVSASPT